MNKYTRKLFAGTLALLSLSACSSDFLETSPTDSTATGTVFSSTENVKQAINGMAYLMCVQHNAWSQGYCGENRIKSIYNEYPSQEFRYNQFAPGWATIMNGMYYSQKSASYCNYPWAYYYEIIGNANSIIAHVDEAAGEESEKLFLKAQALTFRAYCYTELMKLYTPRWQDTNGGTSKGIVLRIDESTGSRPLATVAECYQQIYDDLDDAIDAFTISSIDREEGKYWLTNINVAYAVYARAALNRQDYATALAMAKKARTGYALMTNDEYMSGFCGATREWIFGSYADEAENMWYWTFGTQFACNGYYTKATEYGAGAIEKELTDRMPVDDVRMKLFLTADKLSGFDLYAKDDNGDGINMDLTYGALNIYEEDENGDVVKDGNGKPVNTEVWKKANEYIKSVTPAGLSAAYASGYYYLGAQLKFWVVASPGVSPLCHIRSSEMVLIEAEANYFLKNEDDARASLIELNKTSGRNPDYACTKTGDDLFQEIVDYRELELWGEGFNWYDIKRWNRDIVRKSFKEGGNCHDATATTIEANSSGWTWSIPETETDYNDEIK